MRAFDLAALISERKQEKWREFLRVPSLSVGLYHLKAGETDGQKPHTEDEVYYVISGRASFRAGVFILSPLLGSLTSLLPKLGS